MFAHSVPAIENIPAITRSPLLPEFCHTSSLLLSDPHCRSDPWCLPSYQRPARSLLLPDCYHQYIPTINQAQLLASVWQGSDQQLGCSKDGELVRQNSGSGNVVASGIFLMTWTFCATSIWPDTGPVQWRGCCQQGDLAAALVKLRMSPLLFCIMFGPD